MDLHNASGGYFGCSGTTWMVYRAVAERFGWEPRGPRYDGTGGLRYSEFDAIALGAALDRAIQSELLSDALRRAWGGNWNDDAWQEQLDFDRKRLAELREFCRGGEFRES